MQSNKSQTNNMLLAFVTLLGVIVVVALIGFFMLGKDDDRSILSDALRNEIIPYGIRNYYM